MRDTIKITQRPHFGMASGPWNKVEARKNLRVSRNLVFSACVRLPVSIFSQSCLGVKITFARLRKFEAKTHHGLIVALRGWTLSRHVISLNQ